MYAACNYTHSIEGDARETAQCPDWRDCNHVSSKIPCRRAFTAGRILHAVLHDEKFSFRMVLGSILLSGSNRRPRGGGARARVPQGGTAPAPRTNSRRTGTSSVQRQPAPRADAIVAIMHSQALSICRLQRLALGHVKVGAFAATVPRCFIHVAKTQTYSIHALANRYTSCASRPANATTRGARCCAMLSDVSNIAARHADAAAPRPFPCIKQVTPTRTV